MPPSLFLFLFFSFSLFFIFFGGLNGSLYLTLICPLWDLLILSSLGSFPHFRGNTLYFTRIYEIFHTLQRYSTKRKCNYHDANVCLCQDSRICNDTSASCSNDKGKTQLACGSSIKQVACMT